MPSPSISINKYMLDVIVTLAGGGKRFEEIRHSLNIHNQLITNALRELTDKKMVRKEESSGKYYLTTRGIKVARAIHRISVLLT